MICLPRLFAAIPPIRKLLTAGNPQAGAAEERSACPGRPSRARRPRRMRKKKHGLTVTSVLQPPSLIRYLSSLFGRRVQPARPPQRPAAGLHTASQRSTGTGVQWRMQPDVRPAQLLLNVCRCSKKKGRKPRRKSGRSSREGRSKLGDELQDCRSLQELAGSSKSQLLGSSHHHHRHARRSAHLRTNIARVEAGRNRVGWLIGGRGRTAWELLTPVQPPCRAPPPLLPATIERASLAMAPPRRRRGAACGRLCRPPHSLVCSGAFLQHLSSAWSRRWGGKGKGGGELSHAASGGGPRRGA